MTRLTPISSSQLVQAHPEPGLLSSPGITRVLWSYEPLRRLPRPSPDGGVARSPRQPDRSPVLRITACVRAAPTTPASRATVPCRCIWSSSSAFVLREGLGTRILAFRGLLGLHSRCGPHACEPAPGGSLSPGLRWIGRPHHLPDSYQGLPTPPWAGLSPAALIHLSRRTLELPILTLNSGCATLRGARRLTYAVARHEESFVHAVGPGRCDREAVRPCCSGVPAIWNGSWPSSRGTTTRHAFTHR